MVEALIRKNELDIASDDSRLKTLERTGLLDTGRDELFDRYVRIAAALVDAPISLISLLDRDRQWFKAGLGLPVRETPRAWAFCDHAIKDEGVFEVRDAREDDRFFDNPLVTDDPRIRFYAGAPLLAQGQPIGTLCVIDRQPRALTPAQRDALTDLAAVLGREIDTNHLAEIRADRAAAARAAAIEIEHQMRNMFSKIGAMIDMTAREGLSSKALAHAARRRVVALAEANEVCLAHGFAGAPISRLVDAALRSARDRSGVVVTTGGDDITLSPAAASVIAPLVDELAHDAIDRGTMTEASAMSLTWGVDADRLRIRWQEPGSSTANDAFVSEYLRSVGPVALRAETAISNGEDGLVFTFDAPRAVVEA